MTLASQPRRREFRLLELLRHSRAGASVFTQHGIFCRIHAAVPRKVQESFAEQALKSVIGRLLQVGPVLA